MTLRFVGVCEFYGGEQIRLLNQRRQKEVNRVMAETALDNEIAWEEQHVKNRERTFQQNRQIADVLEKERLETEKREREIQRICEVRKRTVGYI